MYETLEMNVMYSKAKCCHVSSLLEEFRVNPTTVQSNFISESSESANASAFCESSDCNFSGKHELEAADKLADPRTDLPAGTSLSQAHLAVTKSCSILRS